MTAIGRVRINYQVFQTINDPSKNPGIYFIDLDIDSFSSGDPGLYQVKRNTIGAWEPVKKEQEKITSNFSAINGLCWNVGQAGSKVIPPMVNDAYGKSSDSVGDLNRDGFDLFYNPPAYTTKGCVGRRLSKRLIVNVTQLSF